MKTTRISMKYLAQRAQPLFLLLLRAMPRHKRSDARERAVT